MWRNLKYFLFFTTLEELHRMNYYFFKDFFFLMWTVFKDFIEFVTILLLFCVLVFLAAGHVGS